MEALGVRIQRFFGAVERSSTNTRWGVSDAKRTQDRLVKLDGQAPSGGSKEGVPESTVEHKDSYSDHLVAHFNDWQAGRVEYAPADYAGKHLPLITPGEKRMRGFFLSVDSLDTVESIACRLLQSNTSMSEGLGPALVLLMNTADMFIVRFPATPIPVLDNSTEARDLSSESVHEQDGPPCLGECDKFFVVLVLSKRISSKCMIKHINCLAPVVCVLPSKFTQAIIHSPWRGNKDKNWGCWKHVGLGKNKNLHPSMNRMSVLQASRGAEQNAKEVPKKKKMGKRPTKEVDSSSSDEL
ncbi:hypothetical protein T484DRAFT_1755139 [Baffinella frigidus]|nr:hypothetical protein T484DRAFT_1755139 [Cryptophyta sp. CCMP2293]